MVTQAYRSFECLQACCSTRGSPTFCSGSSGCCARHASRRASTLIFRPAMMLGRSSASFGSSTRPCSKQPMRSAEDETHKRRVLQTQTQKQITYVNNVPCTARAHRCCCGLECTSRCPLARHSSHLLGSAWHAAACAPCPCLSPAGRTCQTDQRGLLRLAALGGPHAQLRAGACPPASCRGAALNMPSTDSEV